MRGRHGARVPPGNHRPELGDEEVVREGRVRRGGVVAKDGKVRHDRSIPPSEVVHAGAVSISRVLRREVLAQPDPHIATPRRMQCFARTSSTRPAPPVGVAPASLGSTTSSLSLFPHGVELGVQRRQIRRRGDDEESLEALTPNHRTSGRRRGGLSRSVTPRRPRAGPTRTDRRSGPRTTPCRGRRRGRRGTRASDKNQVYRSFRATASRSRSPIIDPSAPSRSAAALSSASVSLRAAPLSSPVSTRRDCCANSNPWFLASRMGLFFLRSNGSDDLAHCHPRRSCRRS